MESGDEKMDVSLQDFIEENMEAILADWEQFARTLPPGRELDVVSLRNDARGILQSIVQDMRKTQSREEMAAKSQSQQRTGETQWAETHAQGRLELGFDINQLGAEFRALRASVVKLWSKELEQPHQDAFNQLVRFNEAMDQELFNSVRKFAHELERSRQLFLGILGHDLGSPLGAISMSAHLLLVDDNLSPEKARAVARIQRSTTQMKQMITDLLDATRVSLTGTIPLHCEKTNLADVCKQVVEQARAVHPDSQVKLKLSEGLEGVWDPRRLYQVISNLVENAIKHGDPAEPVTVSALEKQENVQVNVHNGGPPIPESLVGRIFDPLYSGDQDNLSRSHGLGLFIARSIVLEHRGTIQVHSSREEGTCFTVCLPWQPHDA